MTFLLPLIIGLVVGAGLGVLTAQLVAARRGERASGEHESPEAIRAQHEVALAQQRADADRAVGAVREELASALATATGLREQVTALVERQRELAEQQKVEQREREAQAKTESQVLQALAPVSRSLGEMREKVALLEQQRSQQHGELSQ